MKVLNITYTEYTFGVPVEHEKKKQSSAKPRFSGFSVFVSRTHKAHSTVSTGTLQFINQQIRGDFIV